VALKDADIKMPDAIITGTGLGCLEDTEKFLLAILNNKEQFLTPTSFIQSTHNTVSGQIALLLKCYAYNSTYAHRGASFESALLDGMLLLLEGESKNALIGGIDEYYEHLFLVRRKMGYWKNPIESNFNLLKTSSNGTVSGEGSTFFVISTEMNDHSYAKIDSLITFFKPDGKDEIFDKIRIACQEIGWSLSDIDLVVLGNNGDFESDQIYWDMSNELFPNKPLAAFKHLSGEYHTASAFGLWLVARILKSQTVPPIVCLNDVPVDIINKVLIYNHYQGSNHAITLLSAC
jgi:3-oxoacyl-(acyl-carrier-protein) synthase